MSLFPLWFLKILISSGLALCLFGSLSLLVMLVADIKHKRMW
ncbi:hypothetical protein SH139x_000630 [Planctomycetaceae bacterium SH139]